MGLNTKGIPNIFPHSRETSTGGGSERIGQSTVIVSLDGSGDTDNIQQGIDLLPQEGGIVFVKEGTYIISEEITVGKNNVKIEGTGRATILKLKDNLGASLNMIDVNDNDNLIFSNFTIDGNKANNAGNDYNGIRLRFNKNCIVENILFKDLTGVPGNGIYIFSSTATDGRHLIQKCTFKDCSGDFNGISVQAENCIITENTIDNMQSNGINVTTFKNSIISNNTIVNCGSPGIMINSSDENIIIGNISTDNQYGIRIFSATSDKNLITGNTCLRNSTSNITDGGTNTHPNGASGTTNLALDDLNIIA